MIRSREEGEVVTVEVEDLGVEKVEGVRQVGRREQKQRE